MGILDWFFGGSKSIAKSTIEGAVTGGIIGEIRDNRADRRQLIEIVGKLQADNRYYHQIARGEANYRQVQKVLDDQRRRAKCQYGWPRHDLFGFYLQYFKRLHNNAEFMSEYAALASRWVMLFDRAVSLKCSPTLYMPRGVSGDVMGTPKMLMLGMDRLEAVLPECDGGLRERERAINERYGL